MSFTAFMPSEITIARAPIPHQRCLKECCKQPWKSGNRTTHPMCSTQPTDEGVTHEVHSSAYPDQGAGDPPDWLHPDVSPPCVDAACTVYRAQRQPTTLTGDP